MFLKKLLIASRQGSQSDFDMYRLECSEFYGQSTHWLLCKGLIQLNDLGIKP